MLIRKGKSLVHIAPTKVMGPGAYLEFNFHGIYIYIYRLLWNTGIHTVYTVTVFVFVFMIYMIMGACQS